MKSRDFFFDLPPDRIAQYPLEERSNSRLLVLYRKTREISHHRFNDLPDLIQPDTLVIFNNSKVRKARLFGKTADTGAETELLLLKKISPCLWQALLKKARKQKAGKRLIFPANLEAIIVEDLSGKKLIRFNRKIDDTYLDKYGHVPLPPYIKRADHKLDQKRYQTVYAHKTGSAAAPTAGLHFSRSTLATLKKRGIKTAYITLHVGLGTFLPIRTENIEDHVMHQEDYEISKQTAALIEHTHKQGKKILAVGTTTVRALETSASSGSITHGKTTSSLFIYPGYKFRIVDQLLTNFHTPGSTLLLLVCALAGKDFIFQAYKTAKHEGYRFFSYGDAMLIL